MYRIVNPCKCKIYITNKVEMRNAFAKIEYKNERLSITGVIAPLSNGNCLGSAGQCVDEIRNGKPTEDWTNEMLQKFCNIWDEWHLNDMRPYCKHMKEMGWDIEAQEKVKVVKWNITQETWDKIKNAEKRAIECLKNGETFIPTPEETKYANVEFSVTTYNDELPEHPEFYEFKEKDCYGHSNVEYKTRSWISYSKHPLGFLGRSCPVCGYRYGSSWIKEEVPEKIIEWLFDLPETKIKPTWI